MHSYDERCGCNLSAPLTLEKRSMTSDINSPSIHSIGFQKEQKLHAILKIAGLHSSFSMLDPRHATRLKTSKRRASEELRSCPQIRDVSFVGQSTSSAWAFGMNRNLMRFWYALRHLAFNPTSEKPFWCPAAARSVTCQLALGMLVSPWDQVATICAPGKKNHLPNLPGKWFVGE